MGDSGNEGGASWAGGLAQASDQRQTTGADATLETGRVIQNPVSGERIIVRQSGAQTGGESLVFDLFLPPGGHVPAGHVHPNQEERFTVLSGLMRFRLGWRAILAGPGETIVIPRGAAHWFGNAGVEMAHARVEVRPALRMEELFEASEAIGLAAARRGSRLPHPSDLARFLLQFQREVAVPHAPMFLVRALLTPFTWLGKRRAGGGRGSYGAG